MSHAAKKLSWMVISAHRCLDKKVVIIPILTCNIFLLEAIMHNLSLILHIYWLVLFSVKVFAPHHGATNRLTLK